MNSDRALMQAWRAGDDGAFDLLVERYHAQLFGVLIRICRNREDAEEAYSETLVRLFRYRDRYEERSTFRAWLFSIARTCAADAQRRRGRWFDLRARFGQRSTPPPAPSLDAELRQSERARTVEDGLRMLPEEHRLAVLLRYHHDLDHDELAAALDLTERQVRDRLSYARRRLRQILPEEYLDD